MLSIYKASAGSGKTWRLSLEYLKLLLNYPDTYKHILAVTFTNKATMEMKERILNELYHLATDDVATTSSIKEAICRELTLRNNDSEKSERRPITPKEIKERAQQALSLLLHDYGHFRVETIDGFFQSILRNLARELGLGTAFNIELDGSEMLEKAVDNMIEGADKDQALLEWIEQYLESELEEGKDRHIDKALKDFGKNIFREYFQTKEKVLSTKLKDKHFLRDYREKLNKIKASATSAVQNKADIFFQLLEDAGFEIDDLSYGKSGVAGYFLKIRSGNYSPENALSSRVQDALGNPEKWAKSKHPDKDKIVQLAQDKLIPLLDNCISLCQEKVFDIYSADFSLKHLYKVGLLTDISQKVHEQTREENIFLLSDTAILLRALIGDSDSPFIFEKIGTDLHHTMIDEFQDTSHLQWKNFKPLLMEGLANGYDSLVVGDEKQSIYRFRNGDWRILNRLEKEMKQENVAVKTEQLPNNFRSEANIVQFNNSFFEKAVQTLTSTFQLEMGEAFCDDLEKAYQGFHQECTKEQERGLVDVSFLRDDEQTLKRLIIQVEDLQKKGIRPDQIAILLRKNSHIPEIAEYFSNYKSAHPEMPYCYDIISDEAFRLNASDSIGLMVAAMRVIAQPDNDIAMEEIKRHYPSENPPKDLAQELKNMAQLPFMELVENLYILLQLDKIPQQESYLFAFMDHLNHFTATTSSDINEFIDYWDETLCNKTIPIGSRLNGIRILSIHKSKGLEYHTVIVPFCDWSLSNEVRTQLWSQTLLAPYNELPLIPVDFGKNLKYSCFEPSYREELLQRLTDSLNLMYVAFTRAEKNLIVYSKVPTKNLNNVSDLLFASLENESHFNRENQRYLVGKLDTHDDSQASIDNTISVSFVGGKRRAGFRQSKLSQDFIRDSESLQVQDNEPKTSPAATSGNRNDYIEYGKLMHQLFSLIRHKKDAEFAVKSMVGEGKLSARQADETLAFVQQALAHPQAAQWYTDEDKLFNECVILYRDSDGNLQERRPDRVIQQGERLQVVDFKFGEKKAKYHQQVLQYMDLLSQMGHKKVEGYLWYVLQGDIEPVLHKI